MGSKRPIAIDLFSGVGGMSLGFKQAGFRVVGAFDWDIRNVNSYRKNFPSTPCFLTNIKKIDAKVVRSKTGTKDADIDLIFGGPPCQGFSVGGLRNPSDERNLLLYDFSRMVREIQPKYFVLENVQGLLFGKARVMLDSFQRRIRRAGFFVSEIQVLDAADFGVPQRRKRTFILGYRAGESIPKLPHSCPMMEEPGKSLNPMVADAIGDLPIVDNIDNLFDSDVYEGILGVPTHYAKIMRCLLKERGDRFPSHMKKTMPLTGCQRTRHSVDIERRFSKIKQGSVDPISRFFRLSYDGVSRTIRAGTGSDHGSHTSPRPIHPEYPRCITVREAARIHSYPDWFRFDTTRWHAFRQIGNSVPPRLARSVATNIVNALKK